MSAIAGILHLDYEPINAEQTRDLINSFHQFPADDIQTWNCQYVFLGCHAQWITPESIGEQLPFYDYERNLAITADAIIDNRKELFEKLQIDHGQRFLPDAQLILLAYSKWGSDTPKHLIGDFAFMIWDGNKQRLFGARDFSGARTLYFYNDQSKFVFSTTMESMFKLPYINKVLNKDWLAEFLAIPGMVEAGDQFHTVYKTIKQIPPSHSISVENGKFTLSRYCTISQEETIKFKTNGEYEEAFREVFQRAVKDRLRTHGKVGAQLSGGLDSGSVVSFAARGLKKENKQLHTYTYIPQEDFEDWTPKFFVTDESSFVRETVAHVGNIKDHYLDFNGKSPLTELDDFLTILEMPYKFFDNSFWLKGISEAASKDGIKILLNGARGNYSISWGSRGLLLEYYASLLKKLKWIKLYDEMGFYCENFQTGKSIVLPAVFKKALNPITKKFLHNEDNYRFPMLVNPTLAKNTGVMEKLESYGDALMGTGSNQDKVRQQHFNQLFFWNKSGTANTKLSLRYGVWDRDPSNDLRVIRYCLAVPRDQYAREGLERSLIRRATKGYLPDKVRLNQNSRGLQGADVIQRMLPKWSAFMEELNEMTFDSETSELLNMDVVKNALKEIGTSPNPDFIFNDQYRVLTRSLIVHRFLKKLR